MSISISIGMSVGRGGGASVAAPENSVLPVISGTLAVGQTLTTTDGTWSGLPTYTYAWKRGGVAIGGATNSTYVLVTADSGATITVTVTATNAGGNASATSAGVAISALTLSLISYWALEEASSTRNDSHGTNHLTDNNTVTQAVGKVGNAAQFTAANTESLSRVDNAGLSTGDIDFTVAAWVFLDSIGVERCIASKFSGVFAGEWILRITAGDLLNLLVCNQGTGSSANVQAAGALSVSTWYFCVAWHDSAGNTINVQLNNGAVASGAWANTIVDSAQPFIIGASVGGARLMNGRIDEVGFWKRLLTVGERTSLYNAAAGRTYPFIGT